MPKDKDSLKSSDTSSLDIEIPSISLPPDHPLAKYNLSPATLYAFLNPSPPPPYSIWGACTPEPEISYTFAPEPKISHTSLAPEPKISHTSLAPQHHNAYPMLSRLSKHKAMVDFFPLTDTKITHDQANQTDEISEVKVAPPSPPRPTYEIKQMEGYLIINGVKYIPEPPPPLQHTVETQTDKPLEFKAIEALNTIKIPDSNPFVTFKADKIPTFKPTAILKTDKIPDSQPAATKVEKTPESKLAAAFKDEKSSDPKPAAFYETQKLSKPKLSILPDVKKTLESEPSTVLKIEDIAKLKPGASKIEGTLTTNPLPPPPSSLYRSHSMPPKISNFSIDPPKRFDMKLSGEDSSDDEFTDI